MTRFTVMGDETVLNLAKKRLQTLRAKSYSLEKLAVRSIVKNVRFYLDIDDQLRQLISLPGVLREKILQTLTKRKNIDDNGKTEEIYDLVGIFPFLLSSRTRDIELNGIMSFVCPGRFKTKRYMDQEGTEVTTLKKATEYCVQLLEWIELLAPNVETLIIKQNNPFAKSQFIEGRFPTFLVNDVSNTFLRILLEMSFAQRNFKNFPFYFQTSRASRLNWINKTGF
ncbi:Hypothetical predicted protein [Cloeon dipterum]|uniref:Uncharacterized protein n=1 Tax=Cloeon dipterum TaxID=197152 RepID=A0A8S1CYS5_9INSE|nr:Hypothetical predicted protein [Cloeon dipterum]